MVLTVLLFCSVIEVVHGIYLHTLAGLLQVYVVPVSPGGFEQVHHSHCSVLCTSFVFSVCVPCNIYWHFDDGVLSREIAWAICCGRPFEKRAGYFCITLTLEPGRKVEAYALRSANTAGGSNW